MDDVLEVGVAPGGAAPIAGVGLQERNSDQIARVVIQIAVAGLLGSRDEGFGDFRSGGGIK